MDSPILLPPMELDPVGREFSENPYPLYAWLREHSPIHHWPQGDLLLVSRAADARAILHDPRVTVDIQKWRHHPGAEIFDNPRLEGLARVMKNSLFSLPKEQHRKIRKLTNLAFGRRSIDKMRAQIREVAQESLDLALTQGKAQNDASFNVRLYADAIPIEVLSRALGVPAELREPFVKFSHVLVRSATPNPDPEYLVGLAQSYREYSPLIDEHIDQRRRDPDPPQDLLTQMLRASEDEFSLSHDEVAAIIQALIVAGLDTTSHGLCFSIRALLEHPAALREVQENPDLLPNAVEECLRWDSFGKFGLVRYALEDFEWQGVQISKGQAICPLMGSALRDPELFENPDVLDIHRKNPGALTFGVGEHFCLGAFMARAELTTAVSVLLLERFPHAKLAGPFEIDATHPAIRCCTKLPLDLGPDQREA